MIKAANISEILENTGLSTELRRIANKVIKRERITPEEGLFLYENGEVGFLGSLANHIRQTLHVFQSQLSH
jgi:aminodeoxyfutalosine synthase